MGTSDVSERNGEPWWERTTDPLIKSAWAWSPTVYTVTLGSRRTRRGRSGAQRTLNGPAVLRAPGALPAQLAPIPRNRPPSPHRLAGGSSRLGSRLLVGLREPQRPASAAGRPEPARRPGRGSRTRRDRRRDSTDSHSTGTRTLSRRRPLRRTRGRSSSRSDGSRREIRRDGILHGPRHGTTVAATAAPPPCRDRGGEGE